MSRQCGRCGERAALRRPKTQEQVSKRHVALALLIRALQLHVLLPHVAMVQNTPQLLTAHLQPQKQL